VIDSIKLEKGQKHQIRTSFDGNLAVTADLQV